LGDNAELVIGAGGARQIALLLFDCQGFEIPLAGGVELALLLSDSAELVISRGGARQVALLLFACRAGDR
jgi:hypothetical protein